MDQKEFDLLIEKTESAIGEKTSEAVTKALEGLDKDKLKSLIENSSASTEKLGELEKGIENLSLEFTKWNDIRVESQVKSFKKQVSDFIDENIEEIKGIKSSGKGIVELTVKDTITTTTGTNPDGIPDFVGTQIAPPSNIDLRQDSIIPLVTSINTNQPVYSYSESLPGNGDYTYVAEGALKPEIDFTWRTKFAEPIKIAAWTKITDEAVQDVPRLKSIATDYLLKKHNRKKAKMLLLGDTTANTGAGFLGAVEYGRTFVAGDMAAAVANPNFMDVINAVITDVYTTHNYEDEASNMVNTVMISPVDFFLNLVSAKNADGLPLFPTAGLFNRVVIGGVSVIPSEDIPAGKIFAADLKKLNITNYIPYTVKIGMVNDDFIRNQFVILGESRFHAFVKEFDKQAFVYDDIAIIEAAIAA